MLVLCPTGLLSQGLYTRSTGVMSERPVQYVCRELCVCCEVSLVLCDPRWLPSKAQPAEPAGFLPACWPSLDFTR